MPVSVTRLWHSYMTDTLTNAATTITGILLLFFMDDENDDDDDTSSILCCHLPNKAAVEVR